MSPHFLVRIICPMDLVGAVVNVDGIRLPKEIDTDPVMVNFVIFFFQANIHKDIFRVFRYLTYILYCYLGSGGSLIQRKGKRQQFATYQTLELERQFQLHRYLTRNRKMELSRSIALTERQVEVWFQNRRAKRKRQMRDLKDVNKNMPNV